MTARWLLVGGTGRVGRLVGPALEDAVGRGKLVRQFRRDGSPDSLVWNPLEGVGRLAAEVERAGQIAAMIVLAGAVPGGRAQLADNAAIAEACLAGAAAAGIRRILVASSSAVYGTALERPYSETDPCVGASPYALSKLTMECACEPWRDRGLEVCAMRIGNVAGADALLHQLDGPTATTELSIDRFADGKGPLRSYIGPASLAGALAALARNPLELPPVVNIAGAPSVRMEDLAEAARVRWCWGVPRPEAVQSVTLDCSLLASLAGDDLVRCSARSIVAEWVALRVPNDAK